MDKKKSIWVVVVFLLIGALIAIGFYFASETVRWRHSFSDKGKQPYDLYLFKQLIMADERYELNRFKGGKLQDKLKGEETYLFVGPNHFMSKENIVALKDHVFKGNTAYIFSASLSSELMEYLYFDECDDRDWQSFEVNDSMVDMSLENASKIAVTHFQNYKPRYTSWSFVPYEYFCNNGNQFTPLGKLHSKALKSSIENKKLEAQEIIEDQVDDAIDVEVDSIDFSEEMVEVLMDSTLVEENNEIVLDSTFTIDDNYEETYDFDHDLGQVNFYKIKFGKGHVYVHTNPIVFTNYYLKDSIYFDYINTVLKDMPTGSIVWDVQSRVSKQSSSSSNNPFNPEIQMEEDSLTKYILSNPPLKWAFYLLGIGGLLFILFRSKRNQRIIPILSKNENNTLAHSLLIGDIYFKKDSNTRIGQKMVAHLLFYVKEKYKINIQLDTLNEKQIEILSLKSGKPIILVSEMLNLAERLQKNSFTQEVSVIDFYQRIQAFKKK